MKIPLDPPFEYEDHNLSFIDLDLEGKFTTEMQVRCDNIYRKRIDIAQMPMMASSWLDPEYRRIVVSKVTGLPESAILKLPSGTYNKLINEVLVFFGELLEDSPEEPPTVTPQITET